MANHNDIVKLALDAYDGKVAGNFSKNDSMDVLREALIDANNGSTKLDYKSIRDGKCAGLFAIIEEILKKTTIEGLQGNEFFMNFVEYRNLALGDTNSFYTPDDTLFTVADVAEGTQGIRRQRLNAGTSITVATQLKAVKIYEELNRVLSGRVDFNEFVSRVSESFKKKNFDDIYKAWVGVYDSLSAPFVASGSYSEDGLLDMIDHVEAATGKSAMIWGTKKAVRKLAPSTVADSAKEDLYSMGYYGKFNGTPIVTVKQVHKTNTFDFMINDNEIYVIPSDIKPIKYVTEGEGLLLMGNPMDNADLSQEFLYTDRYGVGTMINELFGIYRMA